MLRAWLPEKKPLKFEKLNRDLVAFGMICPKTKPTLERGQQGLPELVRTCMGGKVLHWNEIDDAVDGLVDLDSRLFGVSANRDGAGGVQVQIYEHPKTAEAKKKTFGPSSYAQARRKVQWALNRLAIDRLERSLFDRVTGEPVSPHYTIYQYYHPLLKVAEAEGKAKERWVRGALRGDAQETLIARYDADMKEVADLAASYEASELQA